MTTTSWADDSQLDERQLRQWLSAAVHFRTRVGGHGVAITRFDNHDHAIADGKWVAAWGEHYALWTGDKWVWWYKQYTAFDTPRQAMYAARQAEANREQVSS